MFVLCPSFSPSPLTLSPPSLSPSPLTPLSLLQSVRSLSEKFYNVLRRHNYVTPTSYLELILTFKQLLEVKRSEIMTMKQRYTTGLERLEFAASQVNNR